jgi:hypothetical protein
MRSSALVRGRLEPRSGCAKLKHRGSGEFAARSAFGKPMPGEQIGAQSVYHGDRALETREAVHLEGS